MGGFRNIIKIAIGIDNHEEIPSTVYDSKTRFPFFLHLHSSTPLAGPAAGTNFAIDHNIHCYESINFIDEFLVDYLSFWCPKITWREQP